MPQRLRSSVDLVLDTLLYQDSNLPSLIRQPFPLLQWCSFFCLFFPTARMLSCPFLHTEIFGWVLQSTFKEWAVMLTQTSQEWKMYTIYLKSLHKRGLHFTTDLLIYLVMCLCQYTLWKFILYFYYNIILLHLFSVFKLSPFTRWRVFSWFLGSKLVQRFMFCNWLLSDIIRWSKLVLYQYHIDIVYWCFQLYSHMEQSRFPSFSDL